MTRSWIVEHARSIVGHPKQAELSGDPVARNVMKLAVEAGEALDAYQRWKDQARKPGTREELHGEVADVVLTAYILAEEDGFDLDAAVAKKLGVIRSRGWDKQREDS